VCLDVKSKFDIRAKSKVKSEHEKRDNHLGQNGEAVVHRPAQQNLHPCPTGPVHGADAFWVRNACGDRVLDAKFGILDCWPENVGHGDGKASKREA
jgi:hypothetical protein